VLYTHDAVELRPRRAKIVATLGPATASEERIEGVLRAGVDVVRLNFSHGTQAEHGGLLGEHVVERRLALWWGVTPPHRSSRPGLVPRSRTAPTSCSTTWSAPCSRTA